VHPQASLRARKRICEAIEVGQRVYRNCAHSRAWVYHLATARWSVLATVGAQVVCAAIRAPTPTCRPA